jgi:hypothetical protein
MDATREEEVTRFLVSSASATNGNGYSAVLRFTAQGEYLGPFTNDHRVVDPRGLCLNPTGSLVYVNSGSDRVLAIDRGGVVRHDSGKIAGLDPGGGIFGPGGRFYITVRQRRTIFSLLPDLNGGANSVFPDGVVPFPRGFVFVDGQWFLGSGIGPSGAGDDTIVVLSENGQPIHSRLVDDPELSPLDMTVAPNGNLVVNSEWPFGTPEAKVTTREYDHTDGRLVRVLTPDPSVGFSSPRGLRLTPDDRLYAVGKDHVVAYEFSSGKFLGVVAELAGLNGQAVVDLGA